MEHSAVQKIFKFMLQTRTAEAFWTDKWHISPYYATSHAIIVCVGYNNARVEPAVNWIVNTQSTDGAWGFYNVFTAEETAYCLQALFMWQRAGGSVPPSVFDQGIAWLREHIDSPYPSLWVGKCLYQCH